MVTLLRQQLEEEDNSLGVNLEGLQGGDGENEQRDEEEVEEEEEEEDRPRQKYEAASQSQRPVAMTIRP